MASNGGHALPNGGQGLFYTARRALNGVRALTEEMRDGIREIRDTTHENLERVNRFQAVRVARTAVRPPQAPRVLPPQAPLVVPTLNFRVSLYHENGNEALTRELTAM